MTAALIVLDLLLLLGLTLRVTRLIVTDDLGQWWLKDPLHDRKHAYQRKHAEIRTRGQFGVTEEYTYAPEPRWARYLDGLDCPFCVGFWCGAVSLLLLALAGGPGAADEWWRYLAGAFTLNYVAAHLGSRLGDTAYDDGDDLDQ